MALSDEENEGLKEKLKDCEKKLKNLSDQKRILKDVIDTLEQKTRNQEEVILHLNDVMLGKCNEEQVELTWKLSFNK